MKQRAFQDVQEVAGALRPSYPVYCLRPEVLAANARRFVALFPGTVLYAVKCNPHPLVLQGLYRAGIRDFDTASLPEIALICETFEHATAYFMHPVKSRAAIQTAYAVYRIRHFVVDHATELHKVLAEIPGRDVCIVVRLKTPSTVDTVYDLSTKFGCEPLAAAALMREAASLGCAVGLAFHVGSQCGSPEAYRIALRLVGETIGLAGIVPSIVDCGGGFPAAYTNAKVPPLPRYMDAIRAALQELALPAEVAILAEPGRALVASACSLLVQIQLRKGNDLYINDGIFGSLSEMALSKIRMPARLVRLDEAVAATPAPFRLYGPTCDSLDVLPGTFDLPDDAREGDWIEIDQLGAYSNALATRFNGFYPETMIEVYDGAAAAD